MALKFSMILQAVDRVTGPARRIMAANKAMTRGVTELARKTSAATAASTRLAASSGRLAGAFARAGRAAKAWAGKAGIKSWGDAAEKAGHATGTLMRKMGGLAATGAKWAAGAASAAGGFALFDLFKTAGQFEQYQIMLDGLMGSAARGKQAMRWITDFAAKTPFELDQVTEAFTVLKNAGLDPTTGALKATGDVAAGMSKPILQAAEAIADAMTGEFERLKELGITARVEGDRVRLSWIKNEQEFSRVASKADRVGLAMAVASAWSDKFGGSMQRQSRSLFGILSNIKDIWSQFLVRIAGAGIFDRVKNKLQEWLDKINAMARDGRLQAWAEKISHWLEKAFDWGVKFVEGTDWAQVGRDMATIGAAVKVIADAIVTIATMGPKAAAGLRFAANPMWGAGSMLQSLLPSGGAAPKAAPGPAAGRPRGSWPNAPLSPARNFRPGISKLSANTQVGGKVIIDLRAPAGAASVRSLASNNDRVPLEVQTGRVMRSAA